MISIIKRNLKLYFRDKASVFFSLLSVLIVIGLYVLFLAELQIDTLKNSVGSLISDDDISWLVNTWIIAGLLSIVPLTSSLGAFGTMVSDREKKIIKDFKSSPVGNVAYPLASIISSCIIGVVMSLLAFAAYAFYIYVKIDKTFTAEQIGQAVLLIILTTIMSAAIMGFMVSFFSTGNMFTAASIVVGTVSGFITGVYVPIGVLPESVKAVIQALPFGHVAILFRKILMSDALQTVFENAPAEALSEYKEAYGVHFIISGDILDYKVSIIYCVVAMIVAIGLFMFNYNRKMKEN